MAARGSGFPPMTSHRVPGHARRVRVVIEFSGPGRWSGTVHAEPSRVVDAPFEGRLDLLRLLEALVEPAHEGNKDR